jgi:hypothetical protein
VLQQENVMESVAYTDKREKWKISFTDNESYLYPPYSGSDGFAISFYYHREYQYYSLLLENTEEIHENSARIIVDQVLEYEGKFTVSRTAFSLVAISAIINLIGITSLTGRTVGEVSYKLLSWLNYISIYLLPFSLFLIILAVTLSLTLVLQTFSIAFTILVLCWQSL